MATIRELLEQEGIPFHDRRLTWGARASTYRKEIEGVLAEGATPILVELIDDLGLPGVVSVDHHGPRAGREAPTSLHQIFRRLRLPKERWTRHFELVAANDRGYTPELVRVGATPEEIAQIRQADRRAQGITEAEEAEAERAIRQIEHLAHGRLHLLHLPHSRTASVTDRLDPLQGGRGYENLLIFSPGEINLYGTGDLILAVARRFPGGWHGGALPRRGFWGHRAPLPPLLPFIEAFLEERDDSPR